jgi:hypothetical protein
MFNYLHGGLLRWKSLFCHCHVKDISEVLRFEGKQTDDDCMVFS